MVTTTQSEDPAIVAGTRAGLYKLLAEVYCRPPSEQFLESLREWASSLVRERECLDLVSPGFRDGLARVNRFFQERSAIPLEEVSVEFTRLFRGVKQMISPPPPYESVYRDGVGHLYGESTMAVQREYRKHGLETAAELSGEPPDHISFELEFMHCLCRQEAESWTKGDDEAAERLVLAQKTFMESHLMPWVPKFCQEIRKQEGLGLFGGLAELTEGWLILDFEQQLKGCGE